MKRTYKSKRNKRTYKSKRYTKRRDTKRRDTKRRDTKGINTKRRNTKRRNTKRRNKEIKRLQGGTKRGSDNNSGRCQKWMYCDGSCDDYRVCTQDSAGKPTGYGCCEDGF